MCGISSSVKIECLCRVTESLLTNMANTVHRALRLANQIKQQLLDFLYRLKSCSSAVTKKTMRMLNHAACQVKVTVKTWQCLSVISAPKGGKGSLQWGSHSNEAFLKSWLHVRIKAF